MHTTPASLLSAVLLLLGWGLPVARPDEHFEKRVRPLLVDHCLQCHGPKKASGGLRLDTRAALLRGGDSGPAAVPGSPEKSLLIEAIEQRGDLRMPPKKKLSAAQAEHLRVWIQQGMAWPGDTSLGKQAPSRTDSGSDPRQWWAFQPPRKAPVPTVQDNRWPITALDRFILHRLEARGLRPSPAADRRTLLRRVTYDLTGLPPTPDEMAAFLADTRPDAYARVVERLLASPAHGERWGRHWLDLIRYADTAGENSDHPLPHAWRYRNWVIEAFERDQPYDEFLREQIAGDLLAAQASPDRRAAGIVATGFLALARRFDHDSDRFMHLTFEDGIDTLGKAFLGLSIGCARCHDHKYDPISSRDYYALYGILDSTKFAFPGCEAKQQPRDLVPLASPQEWRQVIQPHLDRQARVDREIGEVRRALNQQGQALRTRSAKATRTLASGEVADGGNQPLRGLPGTVAVQKGDLLLLVVSPLKNHGADTTLVEWEMAEVGGQGRRWNATADLVEDLLAGNPHADRHGNPSVWWFLDQRGGPTLLPETLRDFMNHRGLNIWRNGDTPSIFVNASKEPARVWTSLPPRSLFVHPAPDGAVSLGWLSPFTGTVRITGRVQDAHPTGPDGIGWRVEQVSGNVGADLQAMRDVAGRLRQLEQQKADLMKSAPRQEMAYAVVEGAPRDARLHLRGDPEKLGPVVPRRWLEILGGDPVGPRAGSGRLELAGWLTSPRNPLTARVMANRIWLHHLGKGLIPTPNDLGTRGQPPTHPELLDWLAVEFVESGWSVKALHRAIVLSAVYQQASLPREEASAVDPNNHLYWRFDRRRLSAEEIRDSLLVAGGRLDRSRAGPHPFPPESAWSYTQHVPFSTFFETDRRSVYLVNVRNRRHPFLGLFDGADPNATTPQRQTTTVPTQALYFLNDPFFHTQAEQLAERLRGAGPEQRIDRLVREVFQREPTPAERAAWLAFLGSYQAGLTDVPPAQRERLAWATLARVLLASNEFQFVE